MVSPPPLFKPPHPIVVGITGASGSIIGFRFIRVLLLMGIPVELIMTEKSLQVIFDELQLRVTGGSEEEKALNLVQYMKLPSEKARLLRVFGNHRLDAPPSSGTHLTQGMVIIPCSMGTLGKIAAGIGDNLVCRSADVTLKENRKLILVPRESPMSQIHLRNLLTVSQAGGLIVPPMLTFYLPDFESMDGQINYIMGKVLDLLGIEHTLHTRWGDHRGDERKDIDFYSYTTSASSAGTANSQVADSQTAEPQLPFA